MSNLKCPFCQKELETNDLDVQLLGCENQTCKHSIHYDTAGTKQLWQELIRTRKAFGIAVDMLKIMNDGLPNGNRWKWEIEKSLEQITALEQKGQVMVREQNDFYATDPIALEKLVKHMYSEMLDADKNAFDILGKIISGAGSEHENKEFNDLSVKATTIENLLLDMIDKDKKQEVVDKIMNSQDFLNSHEGCIGVQRKAIVNVDRFQGWDSQIYLYRFNSDTMTDMTPEEFWNIYKVYLMVEQKDVK